MIRFALVLGLSFFALPLWSAPIQQKQKPFFTYDVGGSTGTYNGRTYNEINLGLNFNLTDSLTWRNAAFKRFGTNQNEVSGLDSTIRWNLELKTDQGQGLDFFLGPGVRLASHKKSAYVGEAGLTLSGLGLRIGGGAKYLKYIDSQTNDLNEKLPGDEVQYFLTLSGGGGF